MSEEPTFLSRIIKFQAIRSRIRELIEELDLSGSNFTYVLKNEADIRKRVAELSLQVRRLEEAMGPETQSSIAIT